MASSSYFGFGRKPGLNGNSIYFAMTEEFNDDTMTGTKVKQLDEAKNVTSPVTGYTTTTRSDDYSKMNSSDGSNIFVPVAAINCISGIGHKPVLPEKDKIIEIMEGNDKNIIKKHIASVYATPTLNNSLDIIDSNWQNVGEGMNKFKYEQQIDNVADNISKTMQYQQAESTYIGLPNLYNCINAKNQKYYYNIPSPITEKYVIEGVKTDNEQTEHKIAEANKKIQNLQPFSSQDEYTTFGNASEIYTSYNFDITTTESEYAFNIGEYGNINEEFLQSNVSNKTESKDETTTKKGKISNSYISVTESNDKKYTTSTTMIASEKQYIESYYNADELSQWKIY